MRKVLFCFLATLLSVAPNFCQAITFDKLIDNQSISASGPADNTQSSSFTGNPNNILGGTRYISARTKGTLTVSTSIVNGFISHSQDVSTSGSSLIIWDGNPTPGLQPTGLGGLDLTGDGATAFKIGIFAYDFPSGNPIKMVFTIYDATGPTKISYGTVILNSSINSPEFRELPFDQLLTFGQQPADLHNVGAITFFIDGTQSPAQDIALTFAGTNGECDHVPVNNLVLDQCGVCNGDNSSCSDCLGVPNGDAVAGTACPTGELGQCSDGTWSGGYPSCDCKRDNSPTPEICDNVDNNCNGQVDEGSPTTGPRADQCGVCNGDGKSCLDCNGVPHGSSVVDSCGVCGGDGSTCAPCDSVDQSEDLQALDGGAKEQERIVLQLLRSFKTLKTAKTRSTRVFIDTTVEKSHSLQILNWQLAWTLPVLSTTCPSVKPQCITTSNVPTLNAYRTNNLALKQLGVGVINKLKIARKGKLTPPEQKLARNVERQFQANLALSLKVPDTNVACLD